MTILPLSTHQRVEMIDITARVAECVRQSGVTDGVCLIFVAHTTAGITINENADPDVPHDLLATLDRMVPMECADYRHIEGNTAAHVKASLVGSSVVVIVEGGRLRLGTWQGIFFCEFDGPRRREVWVKVVPSG